MPLDLYLAFVAACVVLIVIPGPNVALIVANSVAHGARYGLMTVAGTASAMVLQLALVVLGASALLGLLASLFDWLRWLGVAYLLWLGVRTWRAASADLSGIAAEPRSAAAIFARGFLVSLTNPKTLLFYAASCRRSCRRSEARQPTSSCCSRGRSWRSPFCWMAPGPCWPAGCAFCCRPVPACAIASPAAC